MSMEEIYDSWEAEIYEWLTDKGKDYYLQNSTLSVTHDYAEHSLEEEDFYKWFLEDTKNKDTKELKDMFMYVFETEKFWDWYEECFWDNLGY